MFLLGIRHYLNGVRRVLSRPKLQSWLYEVLLRGAFFGLIVFFLALILGAWWISTMGESAWFDFGAIVWVLLLFYLSGIFFGFTISLGLPLLIREKKLVSAISSSDAPKPNKIKIGEYILELKSSLVSVFVSVVALPFLFFPFLMPLGLLLMSWAFAKEAHATSRRIAKEFSHELELAEQNPTSAYFCGVGILPSVLSLIPLVAFIVWPTLLVSQLLKYGKNTQGS